MGVGIKTIKTMIASSNTEKEADAIIEEFAGKHTPKEKRDFLCKNFNVGILARYDGKKGNKEQTDYESVLSTVINLKWW
jgi:hypothetical protein